jgi:hypothetical protein
MLYVTIHTFGHSLTHSYLDAQYDCSASQALPTSILWHEDHFLDCYKKSGYGKYVIGSQQMMMLSVMTSRVNSFDYEVFTALGQLQILIDRP